MVGLEMMLVRESPWSARTIAAKFTPAVASRPMATVVPATDRSRGGRAGLAALYRSTIEVPPTGSMKPPTAGWLLVAVERPS